MNIELRNLFDAVNEPQRTLLEEIHLIKVYSNNPPNHSSDHQHVTDNGHIALDTNTFFSNNENDHLALESSASTFFSKLINNSGGKIVFMSGKKQRESLVFYDVREVVQVGGMLNTSPTQSNCASDLLVNILSNSLSDVEMNEPNFELKKCSERQEYVV